MSWALDLIADRPIDLADVEAVIADLPTELRGFGGRASWGWSLATDVSLPDENTLPISGAGWSRGAALAMAQALAQRLGRRGYYVTIGAMR